MRSSIKTRILGSRASKLATQRTRVVSRIEKTTMGPLGCTPEDTGVIVGIEPCS
jgi:hypothetical protein